MRMALIVVLCLSLTFAHDAKVAWPRDVNSRGAARVVNSESLKGQILCGYQGWFCCPGDGSSLNRWKHWFSDGNPAAENLTVDMYPDVSEYDENDLFESDIPLKNGRGNARFFSSFRPNVVRKHFEWMRDYGIAGVFHMRFMENLDKPYPREFKTQVLRNVKHAAEATGRVFAVSYNIAGKTVNEQVLDDLRADWVRLVDEEKVTQGGRYLHHNGLPVLRIYGIGFKAVNVANTKKMADLIAWFKNPKNKKYRAFLIGGVPSGWRQRNRDSREEPGWSAIYNSLDGIHPWHVGRWTSVKGFANYYQQTIAEDAKYCSKQGILYMPTMWPGFSWCNLKQDDPEAAAKRLNSIPRRGGVFMWAQACQFAQDPRINTVWMAQFDEVDEGTAIFKVAASRKDVPAGGRWLTLDADGLSLPNDWYLRLCGEAQKMLAGKAWISMTIPLKP